MVTVFVRAPLFLAASLPSTSLPAYFTYTVTLYGSTFRANVHVDVTAPTQLALSSTASLYTLPAEVPFPPEWPTVTRTPLLPNV